METYWLNCSDIFNSKAFRFQNLITEPEDFFGETPQHVLQVPANSFYFVGSVEDLSKRGVEDFSSLVADITLNLKLKVESDIPPPNPQMFQSIMGLLWMILVSIQAF